MKMELSDVSPRKVRLNVRDNGRARFSERAKVGQVCNLSLVSVSERHDFKKWRRSFIHRPLTRLLSPSPRQVANLSYLGG